MIKLHRRSDENEKSDKSQESAVKEEKDSIKTLSDDTEDNAGHAKKKMIIAVVTVVIAVAAGLIIFFLFFANKKSSTKTPGNMPQQTQSGITATGTTTVGMTAEELDLDSLSTKLYVEDVYLSNGDTVSKGDKILKISDSTLASAKSELERAQKSADLAYREGVITTAEDKISAQSEYDQASVNQKYAQQTYDETVGKVTDQISDLQDQIDDEQDLIDEYTKAVNENYYYTYYDVENKKKERDDTFALQMKLYNEWGIEALTDTSEKTETTTSANGQNGQSGSVNVPSTVCGKAGFLQGYILGYAGTSGDAATSFSSWWSSNYGNDTPGDSEKAKYGALLTELGITYDTTKTDWWTSNSNTAKGKAESAYSSAFSDGMQSGQQAAATNQKAGLSSTQASATVDTAGNQEKVTVYKMLTEEVEEENTEYKEALKNYKEKTALAPTNLAKAQADMQKLEAQLTEQQTTLETTKADAKAQYDQTLAECSIAKDTYDTAVKKADEELTSLSNAKDDADDDMTYFTETLDDGYLHASKSGSVMMVSVDSGSYISGDEMVMAYTDADSLAVAVSVDQSDIASITLGESAQISIDEKGDFTGTVTAINPVSSSSSKSSVTYTVTVTIDGDISSLSQNLTATVTFGGSDTVSGNSTQGTDTVSGDSTETADTTSGGTKEAADTAGGTKEAADTAGGGSTATKSDKSKSSE